MAAHLSRPLIAKMVLCMLCVCRASMMTKIALSQYNAPNSLIVQTPSYVPYPLSLRTPALPLLLPSHRTRDDTAPFTRSSVLVFSHPRWRRPGERSIQYPIDAIDSFPFSFACRRHIKLSLRPVIIPFACSWPFGRAPTLCVPLTECRIANNHNHICTLFSAGSRRVRWYYCIVVLTLRYLTSGRLCTIESAPCGPTEIFAIRFHACIMWAPISNAPSLL